MNTSLLTDDVVAPTPEESAAWAPLGIRDLSARAPTVNWLWRGYLARGSVTLLTSQWKTGKTTLLSVLLSKMCAGGSLGDREVASCRTGIVTEESPTHWRTRGEQLDFGDQASFFCRPFAGKPTLREWRAFIEHLVRIRNDQGLDLVVLDTLASFLPSGAENRADGILEAMRPLERLTSTGTGVLLIHHPKKGIVHAGQASRGSGALSGYCDIIAEMSCIPGARSEDRRRRLFAYSRHQETPRELIIKLSADGRDYSGSTEEIDLEWEGGLETVRELLRQHGRQMTREMLLKNWPEGGKPHDTTLWRWLDRAAAAGFLIRHGPGSRYDPYRYSLPGVEAPWDKFDADLGTSWRAAARQLETILSEDAKFDRFLTAKPTQRRKK